MSTHRKLTDEQREVLTQWCEQDLFFDSLFTFSYKFHKDGTISMHNKVTMSITYLALHNDYNGVKTAVTFNVFDQFNGYLPVNTMRHFKEIWDKRNSKS